VILSANSSVLAEKLREVSVGGLLQLDPLCCRSCEVAVTMLQFLYSGQLHCRFAQDAFLLWQLLCLCVQYRLPAPLTNFARTALVASFQKPENGAVLPVLCKAAEHVSLTMSEYAYVIFSILTREDVLENCGDDRGVAVIRSALTGLEKLVFEPRASQSPTTAS